MSYRFTPHETPARGLRRIAREELAAGVADATDPALDAHVAIHESRKRCKRLRGLLHLFRGSLPARARENERFAATARELSHIRDAVSVLEAFEDALAEDGSAARRRRAAPFVAALEARRDALASSEAAVRQHLSRVADEFRIARAAAGRWRVAGHGWETIGGGLEHVYGRGRSWLARVEAHPTTEALHTWRRWVKYHWYHVDLLADSAPGAHGERLAAVDRLGSVLGTDHDCAMLETLFPDLVRGGDAGDEAADLLRARRRRLQTEALALGRKLYRYRPPTVAARFERRWRSWHAGGG